MKSLILFSLVLIALVGFAFAQRCVGRPRNYSCIGPRNVGHSGRGCNASTMWYYDARARKCRQMRYLGCAGNNNRWCSITTCIQRCIR